jgi:hypothetical protein
MLRSCSGAVCVLLIGLAGAAVAEDAPAPPPPLSLPSPITDHFALSGIYFLGHVATTGHVNAGSGIPGTPFNAEQILGLTDEVYQPRFEIMFRLEDRGRLRVDFFDLRRNGASVLDEQLQYGDQTFVLGDKLVSTFDWRQMDLTYTYSFLRTEHFELGAGAGVHLIEAYASVEVPSTPNRDEFSGAGPFATLALDGTWAISQRWAISARAQYLNLSVGSLTGTLGDYHGDVQYRWRRHMAFGLGYERSQAQLQVRNEDPSGVLQLTIRGPEAFVRVSF